MPLQEAKQFIPFQGLTNTGPSGVGCLLNYQVPPMEKMTTDELRQLIRDIVVALKEGGTIDEKEVREKIAKAN
ncbi:MAG: hypothetical protein HGB26_00855 [Desulfobulbaceae bacterium]|nr:hypothetical protein [Desulfobulbaceae bacterium]